MLAEVALRALWFARSPSVREIGAADPGCTNPATTERREGEGVPLNRLHQSLDGPRDGRRPRRRPDARRRDPRPSRAQCLQARPEGRLDAKTKPAVDSNREPGCMMTNRRMSHLQLQADSLQHRHCTPGQAATAGDSRLQRRPKPSCAVRPTAGSLPAAMRCGDAPSGAPRSHPLTTSAPIRAQRGDRRKPVRFKRRPTCGGRFRTPPGASADRRTLRARLWPLKAQVTM